MCFFFFFFKQKTAYEMVMSDWSSDVCSSDLVAGASRYLPLPVPERARSEAHVLPYRSCEELLVGVLEHRPDPSRQVFGGVVARVPVAHPHRALVRVEQP